MLRDLLHAARMLRQSKGWTVVVLLSLALGIGANTALFTAANGVLLQTVPAPDPGSLVRLKWAGDNDMVRSTSEYGSNAPYNGKRVTATFSYPGYLELRKANKTLTDLGAENVRSNAATFDRPPTRLSRSPVPGSRPSINAMKPSPSTVPESPRMFPARPVQRPGDSPRPE